MKSQRQNADQSQAMDVTARKSWDQSQMSESKSDVSDFEAMSGTLTGEFQNAAANAVKDDPVIPPPVPNRSVPKRADHIGLIIVPERAWPRSYSRVRAWERQSKSHSAKEFRRARTASH